MIDGSSNRIHATVSGFISNSVAKSTLNPSGFVSFLKFLLLYRLCYPSELQVPLPYHILSHLDNMGEHQEVTDMQQPQIHKQL